MLPHMSTTPFGRRSLTLAHVATQQIAKSRPPEKAIHKWNVFRAICTAKPRIGVSERAQAMGVDEIMVIGGGELYRATLDRADRIVLSEVDLAPQGDAFFPALDMRRWREVSRAF